MRLLAAALMTLAGCSSPAPVDEGPAPWRYTRDSAIEGEDVAETPADTAPAPDTAPMVDTADAAPPPDTADTAPTCKPATTCTTTTTDATPCGFHADGCGGMVSCAVCPTHRKCITSASEPPTHCGCKFLSGGVYCVTKAGVPGGLWECPADAVPVGPNAQQYSDPKADVSWWCMGKED